jgi:hypothetical protein
MTSAARADVKPSSDARAASDAMPEPAPLVVRDPPAHVLRVTNPTHAGHGYDRTWEAASDTRRPDSIGPSREQVSSHHDH